MVKIHLIGLLLVTTSAVQAQAPTAPQTEHDARPVATAVRTDQPIRLDGKLDDAAWAAAPVFDEFIQIDPQEGEPASQRTEARVLYDDQALYIGVRLHDDGPITGRLGRRDMPLGDSDWLGVMIDSYHDHRTAFGFDVNPAGVRRDQIKVIEQDDNSWDPVWDAATTVDSAGWTAEYRIPFSQLRFSSADRQTWGLQFERMIGRLREYSVSTFIPKSEQGGVPKYGHLNGLQGIRPGKRLEVLPYTVARGEYVDPGANPYRGDSEHGISAGVDVKYRVSSNLTVDATINPDFGQVEVDPAVINLGVYETFFQEKRPFFIEGSEIFGFPSGGGGQLFYTRRIGRTPQLRPGTPFSDVPDATTILGAAKMSGRTAGGWSVGVMEALTQRERARFLDADGLHREMSAEPTTNYFVSRARRDLRGGASALGGIFTAVNRELETEEERRSLRSAAYTGGLDFRHEWDDREWAVRGAVALSHVRGDERAITLTQLLPNHYFQRPDAFHLAVDPDATSLTGLAANLSIARQAGRHWRGQATVATTTPGYEVNDLGFNYRTDRRDADLQVTYVENQPGTFWRNWSVTGGTRWEYNLAGQRIANWNRMMVNLRHLDFWSFHGRANYSMRAFDDRLTRGGPIAVRPASWDGGFMFMSDPRKAITMQGGIAGARTEFGSWAFEVDPRLSIKSGARWSMSLGPRLFRGYNAAQFVSSLGDPAAVQTYGRRYVFAPIEQTEVGLETRLNLTFSPKLSLEMYAQPLISSGSYGAPAEFAAAGTYRFDTYPHAERFVQNGRPGYRIDPDGDGPQEAFAVPDRDFNVRALRGNAVLRWEWRRGSTLFVAWQQSRQGYEPLGSFDFDRDRRALFAAEPDDILVVKVNYWLNP